jgi:hypothetical protein
MLANPMSDLPTHMRWFLETACSDLGLFNRTVCEEVLVHRLPACLDAIELAYTGHSPATSEQASGDCAPFFEFEGKMNKSIYDTREEVCLVIPRLSLKSADAIKCEKDICLPVLGHIERSLNHRTYRESVSALYISLRMLCSRRIARCSRQHQFRLAQLGGQSPFRE